MGEITKKEAVALSAVIYFPEMNDIIMKEKGEITMDKYLDKLEELVNENNTKYPTEQTMNSWDEEYLKNHANPYGGSLSRDEFMEVVDFLQDSETLKDMQLTGFEDNEKTGFRAFTLTDPEGNTNPVMVFRGTAADGQWDDNLAMFISSQTPSQKEAIKYVAKSGLEHITPVGHSKAGNYASVLAYLMPEGIIDKAYSVDGPGFSIPFEKSLTEKQKKTGRKRTIGIHDSRDLVNALLGRPDGYSEYFYPIGKEYEDLPDYQKNGVMKYFGAHKPNYYLAKEKELRGIPDKLPITVNLLTNSDLLYHLSPAEKIAAGMFLSSQMYSKAEGAGIKDTKITRWSLNDWVLVLAAEEKYHQVLTKRENTLMKRLSEMYGIKFSSSSIWQPPNSEVVDGAILECWYCSGSGTLKVPSSHGKITRKKAVAIKTDTENEVNICMDEGSECTAELVQVPSNVMGAGDMFPCQPELLNDWLLTEENKTVNGEEIVLKKSVLGCLKGGIITIFHNGQVRRAADLKNMEIRRKSLLDKGMEATVEYGRNIGNTKKKYTDELIESLMSQTESIINHGAIQGKLNFQYSKERTDNTAKFWEEQWKQTERLFGSPYTKSGNGSLTEYAKESMSNAGTYAQKQIKNETDYLLNSGRNVKTMVGKEISGAIEVGKDTGEGILKAAMDTWDYLGDMQELRTEANVCMQEQYTRLLVQTAEGILGLVN